MSANDGTTELVTTDSEEEDSLRLTPRQQLFLRNLSECDTITEACRRTAIHYNTWFKWKTTSPDFAKAYARLSSSAVEEARLKMDRLMNKASDRVDEMLDARQIEKCPYCKQPLVCGNCNAEVVLNNFQAVGKAVDMLMKRQGEYVTRTRVEGEIHHLHGPDLSHDERVALAMWGAGLDIPPHLEAGLKAKNQLPERGQGQAADTAQPSAPSDAVDAEYRDLDLDASAHDGEEDNEGDSPGNDDGDGHATGTSS